MAWYFAHKQRKLCLQIGQWPSKFVNRIDSQKLSLLKRSTNAVLYYNSWLISHLILLLPRGRAWGGYWGVPRVAGEVEESGEDDKVGVHLSNDPLNRRDLWPIFLFRTLLKKVANVMFYVQVRASQVRDPAVGWEGWLLWHPRSCQVELLTLSPWNVSISLLSLQHSKPPVRPGRHHMWPLPCSILDILRRHPHWEGCDQDAHPGWWWSTKTAEDQGWFSSSFRKSS